jgi:hypothetical protein
MDDIHVNRTPFGVKVELTDTYIQQLQTTGRIKAAINQLLADSIKTMVMQRHSDIQGLVQNVLNSPDTKALVQKLFEEEVKNRVSKYVDDIYGKL